MAQPKHKSKTLKLFSGLQVDTDLSDMNELNCCDCSNIDINTIGELSNVSGTVKQITTGLGSTIDYIHQLKLNNYVVYNGIIAKL